MQVPAGCETGIFYLILAGLSFGIHWQDLMDHALKHNLDIEYATVYPKLGGWLRCLDRQTFLRAFDVFNHTEIKGKPVLADLRNDLLPVILLSSPPPIRQSLQISLASSTSPSPSSPITPYRTFLQGYPNLPASFMPLSPVDPSRQLHFGVPFVQLVPIAQLSPIYLSEQHYYPCIQTQYLIESSTDWQDGYGGYGVLVNSTPEGGAVINTRTIVRNAPTRNKSRAMTLEVLPDRRTSRTPVVGYCK